MKTTKLETKKEFECPAIVKITDDYYLVSKKYFPKPQTEKGNDKYIAINLKDGKWFDWGEEIPDIANMTIFPKGTKFEIEI